MSGDAGGIFDRLWDVVVAGAGPAGSIAARLVAGQGMSVLLVDRAEFPRHKVCGCCLNAAVLEGLSLPSIAVDPFKLGAVELTSFELAGFGRRIRTPLPRGCVLSRSRLDAALVSNAQAAGARFLPGVAARLGEALGSGWRIELRSKGDRRTRSLTARVAVCADGLEGGFLRGHAAFAPVIAQNSRIGLGTIVDGGSSGLGAGRIRMVIDRDGYVGMVRLEDGRIDVAAAVDRAALARCSPSEWISGIVERNGGWGGLELQEAPRGTPPLTRLHRKRAGDRLFLIGDAAGYVEPFTGEGIAWAVGSALLVSPLVARACRSWRPGLEEEWESVYARAVGRRQRIIRCLAFGLKKPWLCRAVLGALWGLPSLARPLVASLNKSVSER